jgi:hypothetical protein
LITADMTALDFEPASFDWRLVETAGFVVERSEVAVEAEDRHDARFLWIVARAPASPG